MKLVWKQLALNDRDHIFDHIAGDNPQVALELDAIIEQKVDRLIEHPELYRAGRKRGTREMVVHPNYIVFYSVLKQTMEILRVKHSAQRWPAAQK